MRIKLSKEDWEKIGQKMGWIKSAQWSGRSDDYPDDESEGEKISGNFDVDMTDMYVDEFPNVEFGGVYNISYNYTFPPERWPESDDSIEIVNIKVKEIHCDWVGEGAVCPEGEDLERARGIIRGYLLDPSHGWDHKDQIREDARAERPYRDDEDDHRYRED